MLCGRLSATQSSVPPSPTPTQGDAANVSKPDHIKSSRDRAEASPKAVPVPPMRDTESSLKNDPKFSFISSNAPPVKRASTIPIASDPIASAAVNFKFRISTPVPARPTTPVAHRIQLERLKVTKTAAPAKTQKANRIFLGIAPHATTIARLMRLPALFGFT